MRRAFVFLALFLAGCSPQLKNEDEERAYLNNQMNPTVEQFRRRGELNEKYKAVDHERNLRQAEDDMNGVIGNLWSNSPEEKKRVEAYLKSSTEQARAARGSGTAPR
jgi:hypothetical protein